MNWKNAQVRDYKLYHEEKTKMSNELSKYRDKLDKIKKWFENNSQNINFKIGKELYEIIM